MTPAIHDAGPMIVVEGLSKRYGAFTAVDRVSFTVEPGTVTGLLGPNGAGKSTTMRMMVGLTPPTTGASTISGCPTRSSTTQAAVSESCLTRRRSTQAVTDARCSSSVPS